MADSPLRAFGENLFYVEDTVRFYGVPIQTRMVVTRLDGDALWVCSPLPITDEIAHALDAMGRVAHIVSPNKIHNQGLDSFHTRYPDAKLWASPGLPARRPELEYEAVLGDQPEAAWAEHLDQRITEGNVFFSEVVFFHRASQTLIVADLVENISEDTLPSRAGRTLAKMMRIYGRPLSSPEFRIYTSDPEAARKKLDEINAWPFQRILLAHGDLIAENAHEVFQELIDHLYAEAKNRPRHRRALYEAMAKVQ
jgi:hypothetical protein